MFPEQCNEFEPDDLDSNSQLFPFWIFITFTSFFMLAYTLTRYAERSNRLDYEDRLTRIMAGFLQLFVRALHTNNNDTLEIPAEGATIIAAGPHRTSLEALVLGAKMEGRPPRFFATDNYNRIPLVERFLKSVKTIPVKSHASKAGSNHSANSDALETATEALRENGRVALFPQGNFSYIDKEPPIIYSGAAKLAIKTGTPIHVIRLDGFWSLKNPFIPQFVRNNVYYRAFLSGFHLNNVTTTLCAVIDFHLQPENKELPEDEKISEINAQMYAFFRHTRELTPEHIENIKEEIAAGTHKAIWEKRFSKYCTEKQLKCLEEEYRELEQASSQTLGLS